MQSTLLVFIAVILISQLFPYDLQSEVQLLITLKFINAYTHFIFHELIRMETRKEFDFTLLGEKCFDKKNFSIYIEETLEYKLGNFVNKRISPTLKKKSHTANN